MKKLFVTTAVSVALCLGAVGATGACAQDAVPTYIKIDKPAKGTPILVVLPTVSLNLLTASGTQEPKEEWSHSAQTYLNTSMGDSLTASGYKTVSVDLNTYEDPSALQMLKLNSAVTETVWYNTIWKLPTKTTFDYTLGEDAAKLIPAGSEVAPAYALFVECKGSYSSGGRAAMMIGMAALGVGMPMGGQALRATLVDLKTGQVVWYKLMAVPSGTDIRTAEGAAQVVNSLFKQLPL